MRPGSIHLQQAGYPVARIVIDDQAVFLRVGLSIAGDHVREIGLGIGIQVVGRSDVHQHGALRGAFVHFFRAASQEKGDQQQEQEVFFHRWMPDESGLRVKSTNYLRNRAAQPPGKNSTFVRREK